MLSTRAVRVCAEEAGGDAQLKRPKSIGALAVKDKVPHLLRPPGALPYSYELTVRQACVADLGTWDPLTLGCFV